VGSWEALAWSLPLKALRALWKSPARALPDQVALSNRTDR
jgi:hypothetical protein